MVWRKEVMKARNVVLMFVVAALVLALAPVGQALTLLNCETGWSQELDTLAAGAILRPPTETGRWADERGPGYLKSSATCTRDGDGSMEIDYGVGNPGDTYDRVPRGYFEVNPGHPEYAPALPDLTDLCFTFSWRKCNVDGTGPEHVRQLIIYSPNGLARFDVANGETIYQGWQDVTTACVGSSGWSYEGTFDATHVTTIDFWVSAWGYVGPWGEPGSYQVMPTGTPVCIDEIPEPATMVMLGLGGLALLRRRKA
jgi:hypothetical protein